MSDETPELEITVDEVDDVTIGVVGEIDYATSDALRAVVDDVRSRKPAGRMVFDFSQVGFMDSSGLAILIDAENSGAQVVVTGVSPAVAITFRTTGLHHLLGPDR